MARPKGKLLALLAIFVGIGFIIATGAFTTVEADRTAEVSTSGDANALLGLEPNSTSPNSGYATSPSGELTLNLSGSSASGINQNATTKIDHVFNITNNGEQNIMVSIEVSGDGINDEAAAGIVEFYNGPVGDGTVMSNHSSGDISAQEISTGNHISVSILLNTTSENLNELENDVSDFIADKVGPDTALVDEITIVADGADE